MAKTPETGSGELNQDKVAPRESVAPQEPGSPQESDSIDWEAVFEQARPAFQPVKVRNVEGYRFLVNQTIEQIVLEFIGGKSMRSFIEGQEHSKGILRGLLTKAKGYLTETLRLQRKKLDASVVAAMQQILDTLTAKLEADPDSASYTGPALELDYSTIPVLFRFIGTAVQGKKFPERKRLSGREIEVLVLTCQRTDEFKIAKRLHITSTRVKQTQKEAISKALFYYIHMLGVIKKSPSQENRDALTNLKAIISFLHKGKFNFAYYEGSATESDAGEQVEAG